MQAGALVRGAPVAAASRHEDGHVQHGDSRTMDWRSQTLAEPVRYAINNIGITVLKGALRQLDDLR